MELIDQKYCYLIGDVFPENIIAGFTKPQLSGSLPDDIKTALSFIQKDFGVSYLNQKHSAHINIVNKPGVYDGDALFSDCNNNILVVKTADCLPLFFYSKELNTAGVVHMGWRSAKDGILENIPFNLDSFSVVIGTGMRRCCYQVGEEFYGYRGFSKHLHKSKKGVYYDPVSFCKDKLGKAGISRENLYDLNICSFCYPESLFSWRRDRTLNRTLSFIVIL